METPKPANLSGMDAILANARKVMQASEAKKPIVMSESTIAQTSIEERENPSETIASPRGYTREQVLNSNFPQPVKDAMMLTVIGEEKRIQEYNSNNIDDDDDDYDRKPMIPNKRAPILKQTSSQTSIPRRIDENKNSDLITVSKAQLNELVKENVMSFLLEHYNKTITDAAIKKTINVLVKEGKLTIRKPLVS
jgi:hypothetical protein